MSGRGGSGMLRRLSIRWRLIGLALLLFAAMAVTAFYIRGELHEAEASSEEAARITRITQAAIGVRVAFNDLRYWQADLSVSLLALAENNAAEARERLAGYLEQLREHFPDETALIADEIARFDRLSSLAVESYTADQRVIGNTHFAQARQSGDLVDQRLSDLQQSLLQQAATARSNILDQFAAATNVSLGMTGISILVGGLLTFVILRSILRPLDELVASVNGLTAGDVDVAIPPAAKDELGRVGNALLLLRDSIGERERLTKEAEQQRQTIVDAIESMAEGFTLYGPDNRMLIANQRYRNLHPSHEPLVDKGASFAEVIEAAGREVIKTDLSPEEWVARRLESHGHNSTRISQFRDGRWMQISERETHDGGFTVVYSDITEMRLRQDDLEAARDEAERATQVKSEFLANMSHELRTPLNAIIGFSEMMQQAYFGPLGSDKYDEYVKDIHAAGSYLLGVINDILDMSKIEAGQFSIEREGIDLAPLISETVRVIALQAAEKSITVETKISDSMVLYADRRAIKQIVINLLSNAVKFTGNGGHISLRARKVSGAIMLSIEDTGCGIPKDALKKLGRPFEQVQNQFSKNHSGSGLGLAISRSLAALHGGALKIRSTEGVGTIVSVRIPARGKQAKKAA